MWAKISNVIIYTAYDSSILYVIKWRLKQSFCKTTEFKNATNSDHWTTVRVLDRYHSGRTQIINSNRGKSKNEKSQLIMSHMSNYRFC